MKPPQRLERAVAEAAGPGAAAAQEWLSGLPALASGYLQKWQLTPERVQTPGGRSSLVVLVRQEDGTPAALKLTRPAAGHEQEHAALARWDGRAAVRLLRSVPADGVLLLERLRPDVSLRSLPEAKAMLEAANTLQRLWLEPEPGDADFATVTARTDRQAELLRRWREGPDAGAEVVLIDEALAHQEALTAAAEGDSAGPVSLLHGDYHQGQVLAAERAPWLAIDPRPVVGERAYDLAWLVRDRLDTLIGSPGAAAAARRRVGRLSDLLEVDRERLRAWTQFRCVAAGVAALADRDRRGGELLLEFAGLL
ncbi:kinase [Streptomyces sp. A7024]|uniref:Kinase n=1 Tax=Streptomyces coryli TaxID=1128680 RepID=A0A6G4TZA3_9ACTN|nr:aminoglycoside phosphotransferase family protein [Streptomyces coryli]NGN64850.1 kinase [Streptomyces coryli]